MRLNFRALLLISTVLSYGRRVGADFFGEKKEVVYDLLQAAMTTGENKYQYIDDGLDGFPVFGFRPGSEVKQPYRLYLPEKLPAEFTLVATMKPMSVDTSYLFAVLNPFETVVQLGIRISEGPASNQNVSLVYTNSDEHSHSEEVAKFTVPKLAKKWSKIVIKVAVTEIVLYLNCHEMSRQKVTRIPQEMVFDTASTLYIAQAGPHIQEKYNGLLQSLKLYTGHPPDLIKCSADFESLSTVQGSGDDESIFEGSGDIDFEKFGQEENDELNKSDGINPPPFITPPPPDPVAKGIRGEKGEKGDKGDSVRGPPGPPGPPGAPGPPGTGNYDSNDDNQGWPLESDNEEQRSVMGQKGEPGSCTCNATALIASFTMPKMIEGPKGEPGLPGVEGKQGQMGLPGVGGPPGERGRTGEMGPKGDKGDVGSTGPEGSQGQKGDPGRDGIPGEPGAQGPPGPPGKGGFSVHDDGITMRPGLPGRKGDPGTPGRPGPKGESGIPGDKGLKGESGSKGPKGDHGKEGARGMRGFKGEPGSPGNPGIAGSPGENGRPASKGAKGDAGPEGKTGPPGPPGPAGEGVIAGIPGKGVAGLEGIKGDKGDLGSRGEKGDSGPKGEKGDRGDSGKPGIPGTNGIQGPLGDKGDPGRDGMNGTPGGKGAKGDQGERGPPGETVISGNVDYISIKGEKGTEGKRGRRGKIGPPGPAGPQGPPGKSGPDGEIGLPGWMGRPGNPGPQGTPGTSGPKGDKGEPGAPSPIGVAVGLKGEKGSVGLPGMPGQPGNDGKDGASGPPGPPGAPAEGTYVPVPGPPGPPGTPGLPGLPAVGHESEPGIGRSHIFGDRQYYPARQGARISELKALQELIQLKESKDHPGRSGASGQPSDTSAKIVPGAVTFQNTEAMSKMSSVSPVGTLAYVIDEEALLVRVNNGWKYIALGSFVAATTPTPTTTISPAAKPPFEAYNLVNHKHLKANADGLRMIALNEPVTGHIHGIRGADYACYRQAMRVGLRGTFRAFLSSRVQNVDSIVRATDRDRPIVNIKGDVLFESWNDMFKGNGAYFAQNPRIYSFNGKNIISDPVWPDKVVWHGSHVLGDRAMDTYCDAWHSDSPDKHGLASSLNDGLLLEQTRYTCDNKFAMLCIEVTSEQPRRRRRSVTFDSDNVKDDEFSQYDYGRYIEKLMEY